MEILTIVLSGTLAHKDSLGNVAHLSPGRIQRMYAGKGITHSEYNDSDKEELNLMQIWIEPNQLGLKPEYEEKGFDYTKEGLQILASPNGTENSIKIYQNLEVGLILLKPEQELILNYSQVGFYFHVISGSAEFNEDNLTYGDSLQGEGEKIDIKAKSDCRILVFKFL